MGDQYVTAREIREQPAAIEAVLDEVERNHDALGETVSGASSFCLVGCGTSYFLALSGNALLNESVSSVAYPGSEAFLSAHQLPDPEDGVDVIVPVSRSGESTETVRATDRLRERYPDADVLGITCTAGSAVDERSDRSIVSPEGSEESVVMTKSYSSMLVALESVARLAAGDPPVSDALRALSEASEDVVERADPLAEDLGSRTDLEKFVFLGSGEHYGLASEAMLKLEEMTLSWTKAYHALEFRHGPKSIADDATLVVLFVPDRQPDAYRDLLADAADLGAETLAVGSGDALAGVEADHELVLQAGEHSGLCLYAPVFQLLGYYRSLSKGLNPDSPQNLSQVVKF